MYYMQNLIALDQTAWALGSYFFSEAGPRPLKIGRVWLQKHVPHRSVTTANFWSFRSNGWCVIMDILPKSLTFRVPPFKVTQGHWNRHGSISYLLLPISVPARASSGVVRIDPLRFLAGCRKSRL